MNDSLLNDQHCEIVAGPLKGLIAAFVEQRDNGRVLVRLCQFQCVAVELAPDRLVPMGQGREHTL